MGGKRATRRDRHHNRVITSTTDEKILAQGGWVLALAVIFIAAFALVWELVV